MLYNLIVDPARAIVNVAIFPSAVSPLAQTTLRLVLGKHALDEMRAERENLNVDIQAILDRQTNAWGIKVANVEINHVDINESMVRTIAKQAEAERLRWACAINLEGDQHTVTKLFGAGKMLARPPNYMPRRSFNALNDIAGERTSVVVFPLLSAH